MTGLTSSRVHISSIAPTRLLPALATEVDIDHLAHAHVAHLVETEAVERPLERTRPGRRGCRS